MFCLYFSSSNDRGQMKLALQLVVQLSVNPLQEAEALPAFAEPKQTNVQRSKRKKISVDANKKNKNTTWQGNTEV